MASLSGHDAVDRFLQRKMAPQDYEGVRWFEPVVFVNDNHPTRRQVRFVVLTEDSLQTTDNPPKKLLPCLRYADILRIHLSHELPDYVRGDVGERTMHIQVQFQQPASSPGKSPRPARRLGGTGSASTSPRGPSPLASPEPRRFGLSPRFRRRSGSPGHGSTTADSSPSSSGRSSPVMPQRSPLQTVSSASVASPEGLGCPPGYEPCSLHLFTLQDETTLLRHLQAAWINEILRASAVSKGKPARQKSREQQTLLFQQLMQEYQAASAVQDKYGLLDELCTACAASIHLKRLFWRTRGHLYVLYDELQLNAEPEEGAQTDHRIHQLEYSVLLVETLVTMLAEAEVLPDRLRLLVTDGGYSLKKLLSLLCRHADLHPMTATEVESEQTQDMLRERHVATVDLLFQLISLTDQAVWLSTPEEYAEHTWGWVTGLLHGLPQFQDEFLATTVSHLTRELARLAKGGAATEDEIVPLFKAVSVLLHLTNARSRVAQCIRDNFVEEFKYFINAAELRKALAGRSPLAELLIQNLERLLSNVKHAPRHH